MTSNHAAGEAESHQVTYGRDGAGNYYLATTSGKGIDIWNITDALNPIYVKALDCPASTTVTSPEGSGDSVGRAIIST